MACGVQARDNTQGSQGTHGGVIVQSLTPVRGMPDRAVRQCLTFVKHTSHHYITAMHVNCLSQPVARRTFLRIAGVSVAGAILQAVSASPAHAEPGAGLFAPIGPNAQPDPITMVVYKSPTCGCCSAWIEHVERNGFRCTVHNLPDLTETKAAFGVPRALESCHTAQVGGYLVEGHVPADLIQRLLREKPAVRGIAVPGMPIGSPGMEGGRPERYDVLLFDRAGKTRVYATR